MNERVARNLDAGRLLGHYRTMLRIRAFEEAALGGSSRSWCWAPSIPRSARRRWRSACARTSTADILLSTHRGHGHTIAKGADTLAMMRELFGREGGTCHGKGGSMHIADFKVGMLGANGVVGANILIAVGAAHAVRLKKGGEGRRLHFRRRRHQPRAVPGGAQLGERGAADPVRVRGQRLCGDDAHAGDDRRRGPGARARSLGIPGERGRRQRPARRRLAGPREIKAVRGGGGPRFLLCKTYRLTGHTGADPAGYRSKEEVETRWRGDPVARTRDVLENAGVKGGATSPAERGLRRNAPAYDTAKATPCRR